MHEMHALGRRLIGPYTNPSRIHLDTWVARAAASVPPGARVLDAGAGDALYRHHFPHVRYETADFGQVSKSYTRLDCVCDLASLPLQDSVYDLILCTQVLEHVPEPLAVLTELRRVLKPRSSLWLSVPLFYEEHEQPYDFYRFTRFGLERLMERAGLAVKSIEWMEGFYGTLSYEFHFAASHLQREKAPLIRFIAPIGLEMLARWCARHDLDRRVVDLGMPINYCVVADRV